MNQLSSPPSKFAMRQLTEFSKKPRVIRSEDTRLPALRHHFSSRAGWLAVTLALGVFLGASSTVSANATPNWGDNGSGICSPTFPSELGTYCMQSVTGWIQINAAYTQNQAISCSNNSAATGEPSLAWSTDGQAYNNAGPWYSLFQASSSDENGEDDGQAVAWQTGNGGDASLDSEVWCCAGQDSTGSNANQTYGSGGATVSNVGGNGYWQAALGCTNLAGCEAGWQGGGSGNCAGTSSANVSSNAHSLALEMVSGSSGVVPNKQPDRTIDSIDRINGRAFLAREYVLQKGALRTDTRTCPAGMVRHGKLSYTIQEFTADHQAPQWKDRSLVKVVMTPKGRNAAKVAMTLRRGKNPTVFQFQMRCVNSQ